MKKNEVMFYSVVNYGIWSKEGTMAPYEQSTSICTIRTKSDTGREYSHLASMEAGKVYKESLWLPEDDPEKALKLFLEYYKTNRNRMIIYSDSIKSRSDILKQPPIEIKESSGPIVLYRMVVPSKKWYRVHGELRKYSLNKDEFISDWGRYTVSHEEGEVFRNMVWFRKERSKVMAQKALVREIAKKIHAYEKKANACEKKIQMLEACLK